jgi:hypothetical protein
LQDEEYDIFDGSDDDDAPGIAALEPRFVPGGAWPADRAQQDEMEVDETAAGSEGFEDEALDSD